MSYKTKHKLIYLLTKLDAHELEKDTEAKTFWEHWHDRLRDNLHRELRVWHWRQKWHFGIRRQLASVRVNDKSPVGNKQQQSNTTQRKEGLSGWLVSGSI